MRPRAFPLVFNAIFTFWLAPALHSHCKRSAGQIKSQLAAIFKIHLLHKIAGGRKERRTPWSRDAALEREAPLGRNDHGLGRGGTGVALT